MSEETKDMQEPMSFVDVVLGGESHSPEGSAKESESALKAVDDGDAPIPEDDADDEFGEESDSVESAKESAAEGESAQESPKIPKDGEEATSEEKDESAEDPEVERLKQQVESYRKRLHDTQAAMHRATGERSRLRKELEELKAKQAEEDDWFSETDKARVTELETAIRKADETVIRNEAAAEEITKQRVEAEWDAAAAPVIAKHKDFEEIVYDKLTPLLDPVSGNAQVRAAYDALPDKGPAAVYEFSKKMLDVLEFQRDPEGYKENLRKQMSYRKEPESVHGAVEGKEGLDMLPSADMPGDLSEERPISFVDALFG